MAEESDLAVRKAQVYQEAVALKGQIKSKKDNLADTTRELVPYHHLSKRSSIIIIDLVWRSS